MSSLLDVALILVDYLGGLKGRLALEDLDTMMH